MPDPDPVQQYRRLFESVARGQEQVFRAPDSVEEIIGRLHRVAEFPFEDEEIPLSVSHSFAQDWDWLAFILSAEKRHLTMPSAAAAVELVLPMLYRWLPRSEHGTLDTFRMLLEVSIRGGSRFVIENLDWNFWRREWPMLVARVSGLTSLYGAALEDEEGVFSREIRVEPVPGGLQPEAMDRQVADGLELAAYACGFWLEHLAVMAQNLQGSITWVTDEGSLYPEMTQEERDAAIGRILYEKESLALSVVYALLALASYYSGMANPTAVSEGRNRFHWESAYDAPYPPPFPIPYFRVVYPRPNQEEIAELLRKWLRIWWLYFNERVPIRTPFTAPGIYIEEPVIEPGPWRRPPEVPFFLEEPDFEGD